jgi:hypothetical protein
VLLTPQPTAPTAPPPAAPVTTVNGAPPPAVAVSPIERGASLATVGGAELPAGELVLASDLAVAGQTAGGKYSWPDGSGGAWRWESIPEWWRRVRAKRS